MKIAWPSKQTCSGRQKKWPLLLTHWRNGKKQILSFSRRNHQPLNPTSNQNTVFITGCGERKPKDVKSLCMASENEAEHLEHLRILFERLEQNGLVVNPAKCRFGCPEIDFLGHHITKEGTIPLGQKVQAVREFPKPINIRGLQEFVGIINFYNRFLPHSAKILSPLYQAIGKNGKSIKKITWSVDMDCAFDRAKEMLANATMLSHPDPSSPIALTTDASDTAVGAVLEQKVQGDWQPLAFLSKKLKTIEQKYSTYDRELLAIYLGIKHFKYF